MSTRIPAILGALALRPGDSGPSTRSAALAVARIKESLELRVAQAPDDVPARVALGELYLGIGLARRAREHLYAASLAPPTSWTGYQRLQALLRRAEAHAEHAFDRPAGAPPLGVRTSTDRDR